MPTVQEALVIAPPPKHKLILERIILCWSCITMPEAGINRRMKIPIAYTFDCVLYVDPCHMNSAPSLLIRNFFSTDHLGFGDNNLDANWVGHCCAYWNCTFMMV